MWEENVASKAGNLFSNPEHHCHIVIFIFQEKLESSKMLMLATSNVCKPSQTCRSMFGSFCLTAPVFGCFCFRMSSLKHC